MFHEIVESGLHVDGGPDEVAAIRGTRDHIVADFYFPSAQCVLTWAKSRSGYRISHHTTTIDPCRADVITQRRKRDVRTISDKTGHDPV
jgi:hypothetical protein